MRRCICPNCGAELQIDVKNRDFAFCQYCGSKIMLDDYRSTHRIVDEARIKEADIDKLIRLKELELKEKEMSQARKGRMIAYIVALAFVLIGLLLSFVYEGAPLMGIAIGAWIAFITFSSGQKNNDQVGGFINLFCMKIEVMTQTIFIQGGMK